MAIISKKSTNIPVELLCTYSISSASFLLSLERIKETEMLGLSRVRYCP